MRRLSAVFLFAIRIAAFPVPGEVQTDLDHHFADEIISGRDGDGAQLVGRSKQPVHFNPLAARQFDFGSIFGGRPGGQRPAGQLPSIPGFPFGRGSQGGRGGGRGSRGGRGQQGQQPQPNRPPGLPSNPQPGSTWLPGGVPAGGPGYQSSTDAPPVEPNPTDPAVEDTPPAPVEPLPSSSPSPAPEGPLLPGGVPAGGPGYEAQNSANEPSAAPAPIPSSDDGPVAPIEPRPKPSPAPTSSLEATPASPVTPVAGPGPVVSLENGPPSPSQPNSSPDGVTAPVGDPYLVTLPPLKPSDPLPDSKPKGVLAPQPLNGGASFTNTPGLPAGEPYVVALPDSKPKATSAPPNTNDGASFTNGPGLPGGDPYVVTLPNPVLEGSPAPPTPADGISFTNSPGLPGGDPYVVILPGSNPKATVAPQSTNNSATFANSPGLPASDPYVVTLPKPKPQTTAAAQALPKDVPMSSSPAKAPPPDEMSFSSSVGALPGDPSVPILPKPQATSRAADSSGTKPEGTPLPNSGSLPPLGKIGVLPGLTEVSVPSPKAEGSDSISPPNPEAHLSSLSTNGGKFEPYNPIADPLGPGTELSEALEDAESNTWGPIIWEPVPAKPKNVKQLPKPVGPPVVVPAPAFPSNNIAPQPSATPTSAPEIPNSPKDPTSPGLQEPSAPDILAPNVAPHPIAGPTSLPASDSPKPQNGVPATESVSEGPYVPIGYDPAVPAAETMGAEGGSNIPPASPVAAEPAPPPIAPPISAQPESVVPEAAPATAGIASLYAQCGGRGYNGPTKCAAGSGCKIQNEWYYQCVAIDEAGYSSTLSQQQEQQQNGGRNDESEGERSRSDPQETYSDRKKSQPFTPQSARPEGRHGPAST